MSGSLENRSAVFTNTPQNVEIYQGGGWWPGSLLGWRHDAKGGCQVWVRTVFGGIEETAWTRLEFLRIPEGGTRRAASPPEQSPSSELTATMNLFAGRNGAGGGERPSWAEPASGGGRRRAPEPPVPMSAQRAYVSQSAETAAPARSSSPATAPRRALEADSPVVPGRHRAPTPVVPGRHRAADTGAWPAVEARSWERPAPRDVEPRSEFRGVDRRSKPAPAGRGSLAGRPEVAAGHRGDQGGAEDQCLTRPMRLNDLEPSDSPGLRRSGRDGR